MPTNTKIGTITPIDKMTDKALDYWVKWANNEIVEYRKFIKKIEQEQRKRLIKK